MSEIHARGVIDMPEPHHPVGEQRRPSFRAPAERLALLAEPIVTVAISTMGDDASSIRLPDLHPCAEILIVVQEPSRGWQSLFADRADVRVVAMAGKGLARSRNMALKMSRTPAVLFADDDLTHDIDAVAEGAKRLLDSEYGFLLGSSTHMGKGLRNPWPEGKPLTRHDISRAASVETMVKRQVVLAKDCAFSPRFGLGSGVYPVGEENVFLLDMLDSGVSGISSSLVFCDHPDASTGYRPRPYPGLDAQVRILRRIFGWAFAMKIKVKHCLFPPSRLSLIQRFRLLAAGMSTGPKSSYRVEAEKLVPIMPEPEASPPPASVSEGAERTLTSPRRQ